MEKTRKKKQKTVVISFVKPEYMFKTLADLEEDDKESSCSTQQKIDPVTSIDDSDEKFSDKNNVVQTATPKQPKHSFGIAPEVEIVDEKCSNYGKKSTSLFDENELVDLLDAPSPVKLTNEGFAKSRNNEKILIVLPCWLRNYHEEVYCNLIYDTKIRDQIMDKCFRNFCRSNNLPVGCKDKTGSKDARKQWKDSYKLFRSDFYEKEEMFKKTKLKSMNEEEETKFFAFCEEKEAGQGTVAFYCFMLNEHGDDFNISLEKTNVSTAKCIIDRSHQEKMMNIESKEQKTKGLALQAIEEYGYSFDNKNILSRKLGPKGRQIDENTCLTNENLENDEILVALVKEHIKEVIVNTFELEIRTLKDGFNLMCSPNLEECKSPLLLLINCCMSAEMGVWSINVCLKNGLDSGSQIPFVAESKQRGIKIILLNTKHNTDDLKAKVVAPNDSEQAIHVWEDLVLPSKAKHIFIIAHLQGGQVTTTLAKTYLADFDKRVRAIKLIYFDSHQCNTTERQLSKFLKNKCVSYVRNKAPVGSRILSSDIVSRISAGNSECEGILNDLKNHIFGELDALLFNLGYDCSSLQYLSEDDAADVECSDKTTVSTENGRPENETDQLSDYDILRQININTIENYKRELNIGQSLSKSDQNIADSSETDPDYNVESEGTTESSSEQPDNINVNSDQDNGKGSKICKKRKQRMTEGVKVKLLSAREEIDAKRRVLSSPNNEELEIHWDSGDSGGEETDQTSLAAEDRSRKQLNEKKHEKLKEQCPPEIYHNKESICQTISPQQSMNLKISKISMTNISKENSIVKQKIEFAKPIANFHISGQIKNAVDIMREESYQSNEMGCKFFAQSNEVYLIKNLDFTEIDCSSTCKKLNDDDFRYMTNNGRYWLKDQEGIVKIIYRAYKGWDPEKKTLVPINTKVFVKYILLCEKERACLVHYKGDLTDAITRDDKHDLEHYPEPQKEEKHKLKSEKARKNIHFSESTEDNQVNKPSEEIDNNDGHTNIVDPKKETLIPPNEETKVVHVNKRPTSGADVKVQNGEKQDIYEFKGKIQHLPNRKLQVLEVYDHSNWTSTVTEILNIKSTKGSKGQKGQVCKTKVRAPPAFQMDNFKTLSNEQVAQMIEVAVSNNALLDGADVNILHPKGGDLYIFQCKRMWHGWKDLLDDGYVWARKETDNLFAFPFQRQKFLEESCTRHKSIEEFKKYTYFNTETKHLLIHYVGHEIITQVPDQKEETILQKSPTKLSNREILLNKGKQITESRLEANEISQAHLIAAYMGDFVFNIKHEPIVSLTCGTRKGAEELQRAIKALEKDERLKLYYNSLTEYGDFCVFLLSYQHPNIVRRKNAHDEAILPIAVTFYKKNHTFEHNESLSYIEKRFDLGMKKKPFSNVPKLLVVDIDIDGSKMLKNCENGIINHEKIEERIHSIFKGKRDAGNHFSLGIGILEVNHSLEILDVEINCAYMDSGKYQLKDKRLIKNNPHHQMYTPEQKLKIISEIYKQTIELQEEEITAKKPVEMPPHVKSTQEIADWLIRHQRIVHLGTDDNLFCGVNLENREFIIRLDDNFCPNLKCKKNQTCPHLVAAKMLKEEQIKLQEHTLPRVNKTARKNAFEKKEDKKKLVSRTGKTYFEEDNNFGELHVANEKSKQLQAVTGQAISDAKHSNPRQADKKETQNNQAEDPDIIQEIIDYYTERVKEDNYCEYVGSFFNVPYIMNTIVNEEYPRQISKIPVHTLDNILEEIPMEKLRLFVNHGSIFEFKDDNSHIQKFALYSPRIGTCVILTEEGKIAKNEMYHHAARSVKDGARKSSAKKSELTRIAHVFHQTNWKNSEEDTLESKLQGYMSSDPNKRRPNVITDRDKIIVLSLTCYCNELYETELSKGKSIVECTICSTKYHLECLNKHEQSESFICLSCSRKPEIEWSQNRPTCYNTCPLDNFLQAITFHAEDHPEMINSLDSSLIENVLLKRCIQLIQQRRYGSAQERWMNHIIGEPRLNNLLPFFTANRPGNMFGESIKISFDPIQNGGSYSQKRICSNEMCTKKEESKVQSIFSMQDTSLVLDSDPDKIIKNIVMGDGDLPEHELPRCAACKKGCLKKMPLKMTHNKQQWYITFNGSLVGTLPMDDSKKLMQLPEIKIEGNIFEPKLIVSHKADHFVSLIKYKNRWLSFDDMGKQKKFYPVTPADSYQFDYITLFKKGAF